MLTPHLGYDEFRLIARLCRTLDVRRLPLAFDFRGYLLRMLPTSDPAARAVAALTPAGVAALRAEVAEFQDLAA